MKRLTVVMMMVSLNAFSFGNALESSGSSIVRLSEAEAKARFDKGEPTCLKDGAKVLTGNNAYVKKFGSDTKPCRKADLYGVKVIKLRDLDLDTQRKILGIKG